MKPQPRRKAPLAKPREALKQAVLSSAIEIVRAGGIAHARITDIAARAGVHETSVYRRWQTRTHLILEALSIELDAALPLPDTGSVHGDLTTFFTALATFLSTPAGRSLVHIAMAPPADEGQFDQVRRDFWRARLGRAASLIQRGIDRGELAKQVDAELLLETLAGPLQLRVLLRNEPTNPRYVGKLVTLVLDGARAGRRTAR